ncbi:MAG: beta-carotene hydroxylase [bacterium]
MWSDPLFWVVLVGVACAMELWAMLLHGRLWHGALWPTHESHHVPRRGWFEFNDVFAVFHAGVAMFLIIYGFESDHGRWSHLMIAAGFGMSAFGLAYFTVHDGFIHGRLPVEWLSRFGFMRRVRNAHRVHHTREHAAPFGLFLGGWELRRAQRRRRAAREMGEAAAQNR